jgi:predicted MPP superfamily phosphohydrolase
LSAVLCISALINFAFFLSIKEIRIKVPNLPIESLKIVHLADLHITPYVSTKKIINIFSKIMDLKPDIIVFTGDIMDFDINKNDKFMEYGFANLKSPYGIYAVSGNHDYYTGIKSFQEMFSKLGIKVLNDENIMVKNTDRTNIINIAGINDINYHNTQKISQSLSNLNLKYPTIFLSHRPESFDIASSYADIIAFAGHTHAGQIPPVWIVRKFFMKYNYGIYNLGKSIMYITSGTRLWGPPMRLFSTSEIAVIILERE